MLKSIQGYSFHRNLPTAVNPITAQLQSELNWTRRFSLVHGVLPSVLQQIEERFFFKCCLYATDPGHRCRRGNRQSGRDVRYGTLQAWALDLGTEAIAFLDAAFTEENVNDTTLAKSALGIEAEADPVTILKSAGYGLRRFAYAR